MRTEQMIPRELDFKDDVKFTAKKSIADNCCCDGCFRLGRVVKITTPETKHFEGKELRTIYQSYWLCDDCLAKLKKALEDPQQER